LNSNYEKTLDKNFEKALNLCSRTHTHDELLKFLKDGNIPEKQYAALMITELNSKEDVKIFISNLINCDGKIREAVAQKFLDFTQNEKYCEYFTQYPQILAKATIDINANISRMVTEGLEKLVTYSDFGYSYAHELLGYIQDAYDELDKIIYKDKKYTINKQLFKLYWCLEGLKNYWTYTQTNEIKPILKRALEESEYTIREKVAQILVRMPKNDYNDIINVINNDENYYVKRILNEVISQ